MIYTVREATKLFKKLCLYEMTSNDRFPLFVHIYTRPAINGSNICTAILHHFYEFLFLFLQEKLDLLVLLLFLS